MDSRRYDRNADLLSQIFWHYTRLQKQQQPTPDPSIQFMLDLLQRALFINDELGQRAEKGLL